MEDLTGKQFGPYQVLGPLGEGGMAAVYRAYQPAMDREVAMKFLPRQLAAEPEFVGRFRQEARVLARLQHPHILPVFDFGDAEGYTYIVMPFVNSGTLKDLMHGQPLPLSQTAAFITQVGDALDYAHSRGLIHRDVKPSNVLVDERGNCLLTDFGIAKIVEGTANFTGTSGTVGTPTYMSPEQGRGAPVDHRTDIYSLGVMLYEMATGRVPFMAETPIAVVFKHIQDPLPLPRSVNPDLPEAVERVILRTLAKEPENRFATCAALTAALQAALLEPPPSASGPVQSAASPAADVPPPPPPAVNAHIPPPSAHPPSNTWMIAAAGGLIILAGLGLWFAATSGFNGQVQPTPTQTQAAAAVAAFTATIAKSESATATLAPGLTPAAVSTAAPSATPEPTLAPSLTPTPSATAVPPTVTPACPNSNGAFAAIWEPLRDRLGCASGKSVGGLVVEEDFQSGKMLWREPLDYAQAVVLFSNGTWRIYQHAPYVEGSPEYPCADANTPAQSPPTPRRGFGTMWCDIPAIRSGLGNATDVEQAYTGQMQAYDRGFILRTGAGTHLVLFSDGAWIAW